MTVAAPTGGDVRRAGLVLAGGRGSRFGRAKADLRIHDVALVERAVALLEPHCGEVVVASRTTVPMPPLDVRVVYDPDGEPSALRGLRSGLDALDAAEVVVVACDLLVAPPLLERLLAVPAAEAVVTVDDHGLQPLCGRYPRARTLAMCERLIDEHDLRVRRLAELLRPATVAARPGELRNVNTWPDAFAASLDVPALSPETVEQVLSLTREVAHGTERLNGPLASFLVGFAAGRRGEDPETVLADAITSARELLADPGSTG